MTFTNTRGPGPGMEQGPTDVCKVPAALGAPVPTNFVNIAPRMQAIPSYYTVLLDNAPMLTKAATIPISSGDEPGVQGGVVSQMIKGVVGYLLCSVVFFVAGIGVTRNTDPTSHNGNNSPGTGAGPSQTAHIVQK